MDNDTKLFLFLVACGIAAFVYYEIRRKLYQKINQFVDQQGQKIEVHLAKRKEELNQTDKREKL